MLAEMQIDKDEDEHEEDEEEDVSRPAGSVRGKFPRWCVNPVY